MASAILAATLRRRRRRLALPSGGAEQAEGIALRSAISSRLNLILSCGLCS
jgi:hypothetical protein